MPGGVAEEEIDEAGAGNLDLHHGVACSQPGDNLFGDVARLAPCRLGEHQRQVAGEVTVGAVAGALDHDLGRDVGRQCAVGLQGGDRVGQQLYELFFQE